MSSNCGEAESNLKLMEALYARIFKGDIEGFLSGIDDDVITYQSSDLPYGGVYHGKKALLSLLGETIFPLIEADKMKMTSPLMAGDNRVIGSFSVPARKTGKELLLLEKATFKAGKIVELRVYYFNPGDMVK